jgi:hypothetical protein
MAGFWTVLGILFVFLIGAIYVKAYNPLIGSGPQQNSGIVTNIQINSWARINTCITFGSQSGPQHPTCFLGTSNEQIGQTCTISTGWNGYLLNLTCK